MTERHATIEDLQEIKSLIIKEWSQFLTELTPENQEMFLAFISNEEMYKNFLKHEDCLVIENEQREIIALCFYATSQNSTLFKELNDAFFRFLTVSSDYGGHGLGKRLVNSCIELSKQNGEKRLAVETSEMNKSALRLYDALGFKINHNLEKQFGKQFYILELDLED